MTPSGEQVEISHGDQRATLAEVGGGIRSYTHAGREVLDGYPSHEMCTGAHGAPLIPWPNRLADGAYTFDGTDQRVALYPTPRQAAPRPGRGTDDVRPERVRQRRRADPPRPRPGDHHPLGDSARMTPYRPAPEPTITSGDSRTREKERK